MDSATSAGIDGISSYYLKQIWSNANDKFKNAFTKYLQRIINANLIEFEFKNITPTVAVALGKDKQIELDEFYKEIFDH